MTEFFSAFDSKTREGGDFEWSIATAAYAYSRTDSGIWDDALATGASSQLISPANINVLSYALSKSYTYNGAPRRLIIGSFAVPSSPTDNEEHKSETDQAASYAFSYYKMLEDGTTCYRLVCQAYNQEIAPYVIYVNAKTFRTMKVETIQFKEDGSQTLYVSVPQEYTWFGDVLMPRITTVTLSGQKNISTVLEFMIDVAIPDEEFKEPQRFQIKL